MFICLFQLVIQIGIYYEPSASLEINISIYDEDVLKTYLRKDRLSPTQYHCSFEFADNFSRRYDLYAQDHPEHHTHSSREV
jgi:hypothetical protein